MRLRLPVVLILICTLLLSCAMGEKAPEISERCTVRTSDRRSTDILKDGRVLTYYTAEHGAQEISVALSKYDSAAGWIILDFFKAADDFELCQYDAEGTLLERYTLEELGFMPLTVCREAKPGAVSFTLAVPEGSMVSDIHVFAPGDAPESAQFWEKPEKVDLMLISTHQDDEELWFGGTLPYYAVERGVKTLVVYMAGDSRWRQKEALSGLWAMGLTLYPDFRQMYDCYPDTYEEALRIWGGDDAVTERMTAFIRQYKPEVIVTHDLNGEYGHPQHKITARHVENAVRAAADETMFHESYALYGAWQVKKLYLHMYGENTIYMDWETPSEKLGGLTPLEVAGIGFSKHTSQHARYDMSWGKRYDNSKFGLVYSVVGEDIFRDDFLENTAADPRKQAMEEVE